MRISLVTKLPDEVQAVIDQQNRDAAQTAQEATQATREVQTDEVPIDANKTQ